MEVAQIRMKHQNNPALRPPNRKSSFASKRKIFAPKSHPSKAYFPEWHGEASTPRGARRPTPPPAVVRDQSFGQKQTEKTLIDISLGRVLDIISQASTPASWCDTEVGDYNDYQQARGQGLFVTPTPTPSVAAQGKDHHEEPPQNLIVTSSPTTTASAPAGDNQQERQQDPASTSILTNKAHSKQATVTPSLSAKALGKQPFVEPAVMVQEEARLETYPQLVSNVQQSAPSQASPDPDTQWAYREAEKVYARQAREDPTWSDEISHGTVDSPIGVEDFDTLSITNRKRRSPGPEAETSPESIPKKTKTKDQQQQRSHTRRYSTLSPKFKFERDQLISALTSNWGNIRLAIPRDLGPRRNEDKTDTPAEPQDWSVSFLQAALHFSRKTRGEPERAEKVLRNVVARPGRQYAWLTHAEDFEKAVGMMLDRDVVMVDEAVASGSDAEPSRPRSDSGGLESLLSALCAAAADEANARRDLKDLTSRKSCSDEDYKALTKALEKAKEADARKMRLKQEIAMYSIAN